ncbi:hypothetical protein AB0H77_23850 [Streptomyces sp. NPDC050844]|uniref:beta family protein n=1 Tax=Streptomyces sp. NPDC050844 TaxID=3155790 RepID=UPI0033EB7144
MFYVWNPAASGVAVSTIYAPILKGKAWEFRALSEHTPSDHVELRPVFEVMPALGGPDPVITFCKHLDRRLLEPGVVVAVDCPEPSFPSNTPARISRVAETCSAADMPFIVPVVRPDSAAKTFTAAREIVDRHECGVCLRLTVHDAISSSGTLADRIGGALRDVGTRAHDADLLIDAGPLGIDDDLPRILHSTVRVLSSLQRARWRSVTLASGAFPANLEHVTHRLPFTALRRDAELWHRVSGQLPDCVVEFSDYGVTHPIRHPVEDPSSPNPFLAYTVGDRWQIRIYDRQLPGNDDFFTLCDDLTKSSDWPSSGPAMSWGTTACTNAHAGIVTAVGPEVQASGWPGLRLTT